MEDPLYQIVYFSAARPELTEPALLKLLASSQQRNKRRGITGLLLHADGSIMQVIEGPETAVKALYAKIARDPRHSNTLLASSKPIAKRDFPDYKMGFKRVKTLAFDEQLPGFSDIVDKGELTSQESASLSKLVSSLLKAFSATTGIDRFGVAS